MSLAFCLFRYFPFGGMQRDMLATARLCRQRGHHVRIYCHTFEGEPPDDLDAEIEVLPVRGRTNHRRAQAFADELQLRLAAHPADSVIGFDKMPGLDLYFAADPCYVTRTEGRPWPYHRTSRYATFRRLEGAVFGPETNTRILLLDERERANYQRAWQTPDARFTVLPPGIARDRRKGPGAAEQRRRVRDQLRLADDEHLLLLIAANYELKGLDRALAAVANLPAELRDRTRLLAVGAGEDPKMRRRADRRGIATNVIMQQGTDEVGSLLQAADALIHPARRDTTGTVLLEAVAAGLPVICTATCGYAHYITDADCGIVLPDPFDQSACNRAVREMVACDQSSRSRAAIAFAAAHELHGMHETIAGLIESCTR